MKKLISYINDYIANTLFQQHKRRHYMWHLQMINTEIRLIIFFAAKEGEALNSPQKQDWELTVSDHELLIDKFRLNWKKLGKTIRPFGYDLNQIPNDYTVEVTNRFKELDLIDRVPEELRMEIHDTVQEAGIQTISKKKKKMQKGKMPVWGVLSWKIAEKRRNEKRQNGCLWRPYK